MPYKVELIGGMLDGKIVTIQSLGKDIHVDIRLVQPAVIYLRYYHWVRLYYSRIEVTKATYRSYEYLPPGVPVKLHKTIKTSI